MITKTIILTMAVKTDLYEEDLYINLPHTHESVGTSCGGTATGRTS